MLKIRYEEKDINKVICAAKLAKEVRQEKLAIDLDILARRMIAEQRNQEYIQHSLYSRVTGILHRINWKAIPSQL